ncbi:aminotransferase class I/II-fold pyridoxal phosphate-dependent enzyme [Paenibacillus sp. P46E]|uniref:aminotransferase class I/II-fold pyridoxal phosphate-dependent enzyme n=1 Tax=Paenibacillus sp. P46E TaxID=1349436 RepID=UPI00093F9572|nr:aminotransferase class I/II-fold pyridoxal phosphate-dependent enzyme [Paenibacillus sp. P46E]OKP99738.1 hypothetical protein A3849_02730 [Paenibacillus sp. P46E]
MNPLAGQLNDSIKAGNEHVYDMLSNLGKALYYPKEGILSQSAEAAAHAKKYNATIGIATEKGVPMHLGVIQDKLSAYSPKDLYGYAPPAGKPELRTVWREKMLRETPSLEGKSFGNPIVTNALTHGLSIVADLFADQGDAIIYPDKNWENYELTFGVRRLSDTVTYPLFTEDMSFNSEGLLDALLAQKDRGKAIVLLNFPNNPTGYTPGIKEGEAIVASILRAAEEGINVVVVSDDAYFGLFFEDSLKESLFGRLANLHPRVLAVKIDGATKEEFVWGFRVGFITFASDSKEVLAALEQKTMGIIRATISSGPHPSQTFVLDALKSPKFADQKEEKFQIMKGRANKVKALLDSGKYGDEVWTYYPFNSGYFMCLKLHTVHADALRLHLIHNYGLGTIALGETDLRVAFSCIEEDQLEDLFDMVYSGIRDLEKA